MDTIAPLRRSEGERADIPGLRSRFLITADRTGDRFAVVEHVVPPRGLAAPVQTHSREDELTYVVRGAISVQVGDQVLDLVAGDSVFKPRDVPHAFWNAEDVEAPRAADLIRAGRPAG